MSVEREKHEGVGRNKKEACGSALGEPWNAIASRECVARREETPRELVCMRVRPMEAGGIDTTVDVCLVLFPFYLVLVRSCLPLRSRTLFSSVKCGFTSIALFGLDQRRASDGSHGQSTGRLLPCLPCTDHPILHAPPRLSHLSCEDTGSIAIVLGSFRPPRVVSVRREETPIWAWGPWVARVV